MTTSEHNAANHAPVYVLVPSTPLPVLDLSRTLRGQVMSERAVGSLHNFLKRFNRPLYFGYATALTLGAFVPILDAMVGQYISVACCTLALPLGLGSLGALRYDVVRLMIRTFDFWFFFSVSTSTSILLSLLLNIDLRVFGLVLQWIGFQNIILIDAQVRGIRQLTKLTLFGIIPVAIMLVWAALDRVDGTNNFSLLSYKTQHYQYDLMSIDVIVNGLMTLILLLAKIGHRKRKILKSRAGSTILECTIYRCSLELKLVEPNSPVLEASRENTGARELKTRKALTTRSVTGLNQPELIQHMRFVKTRQVFDSRRVIFTTKSTTKAHFRSWELILVYAVGAVGLVLSFPAAIFYESQHLTLVFAERQLLFSWIALLSTLVFATPFIALYQRDLLKLLCFSFDFAFYSFQTTSASICLCAMSQWQPSRGIMLISQTIWIHWVFTIDALTPAMRAKLRFHPRYAAPIIMLFLFGHLAVIITIFFVNTMTLRDVFVWEGTVWDRHIKVSVMPFYFNRVVTLLPWCSRLTWRLWKTSTVGVTILRGTVAYDNCFAAKAQKRSRRLSTMSMMVKRSTKVLRQARVHVTPHIRKNHAGPVLPVGVQWPGNLSIVTVTNQGKP